MDKWKNKIELYDNIRLDNYNDYEMLKRFNGAVIKKHHPMLNELGKKEYESLSDYIEELMKN